MFPCKQRLGTGLSRVNTLSGIALCFAFGICCASDVSVAQTPLTEFEQQAILAFSPNGKAPTKVTLSGSATWTSGSLTESGSISLTASSDGAVSETWTLPTQSHRIAETGFAAGKTCAYTDKSGTQRPNTAANCMQPVAWFAPWVALNLLPSGEFVGAADATQPSEAVSGLVKLRFSTLLPSASDPITHGRSAALANRTAVDVSYDSKSALVSSITFNYVLDNDPKHVIEYAIVFADYRSEQGIMVPHRMQRYIQRTLQADITITNASIS